MQHVASETQLNFTAVQRRNVLSSVMGVTARKALLGPDNTMTERVAGSLVYKASQYVNSGG
jgi:hypothetical protein